MQFIALPLAGAYLIELDKIQDDRGFFARVFCEQTFAAQGLNNHIVQINDSLSHRKGTLRGMHYQLPPRAENKIVRCIQGALYDVILDIRPDSATFGQWYGVELTQENRRVLYVPEGFAHGFITLEDHTEAYYLVTAPYSPEYERGIRWDDPRFNIQWPFAPIELSERDSNHRDFDPQYHLGM